ncbi:MAG: glycosyltransferase family 4 protein [Methylovirgula sp.]|nr:glycosyltransferase family 4 protein [Methylovirgula sp.]
MHAIVIADFAELTGGAQRVAVESARALAEAGARVTYVHATEATDSQLTHPAIETICLHQRDVWTLGAARGAVAGIWNAAAAQKMRAALAPFAGAAETVIHLHQWTRAFSPAILPVLMQARLPLFITAHDYFLACPNGVLFRFDRTAPCELPPMSLACISANCDPRSYLHKAVRVLRTAATRQSFGTDEVNMIHVSDRGRDTLSLLLPKNWRHDRVDNPISIAKAPPIDASMSGRSFAFIGRLTPEKGVLLAARAAAAASAPILFVGDGPAAAGIKAACPHAEITGWLSPAALETLLRTHVRAVVAPSLWMETGPMTVYEAQAFGLATIVSNRCGAAERVTTQSGFVVAPTAAALAEAFTCLKDDRLAQDMGRAAYNNYWVDPPTPAAHARRLLALYAVRCRPGREAQGY